MFHLQASKLVQFYSAQSAYLDVNANSSILLHVNAYF
jgi:hypothetical protein